MFVSKDGLIPPLLCEIQLGADFETGSLTFVVRNESNCQPFTLQFNRIFDMRIEAENSAGNTTLAEALPLSECNYILITNACIIIYTYSLELLRFTVLAYPP